MSKRTTEHHALLGLQMARQDCGAFVLIARSVSPSDCSESIVTRRFLFLTCVLRYDPDLDAQSETLDQHVLVSLRCVLYH